MQLQGPFTIVAFKFCAHSVAVRLPSLFLCPVRLDIFLVCDNGSRGGCDLWRTLGTESWKGYVNIKNIFQSFRQNVIRVHADFKLSPYFLSVHVIPWLFVLELAFYFTQTQTCLFFSPGYLKSLCQFTLSLYWCKGNITGVYWNRNFRRSSQEIRRWHWVFLHGMLVNIFFNLNIIW